MRLLTLHPGGRHGDEKPSGINLPSGIVPGTASESPRIRFLGGGGFGMEFVENNRRPDDFRVIGIYGCSGGPRQRTRTWGGSWPRVLVGPQPGVAHALWVAPQASLRTSSSSWRKNNSRKISSNF